MRGRDSSWVLLAAAVSLVLLLLSIRTLRRKEGLVDSNSCDVYLNGLQTNNQSKYNELIDRITKTTLSPDGSVFQNRCHEIREMRRDCGLAMCSKPIVSSMCYDVCKDMQVVAADWRLVTINKMKKQDQNDYENRYDIGFDINFNIQSKDSKDSHKNINYDKLKGIDNDLVDLKLRMVIENFVWLSSQINDWFSPIEQQNKIIPYYHLKKNGDFTTTNDIFNVKYRCLECNIWKGVRLPTIFILELNNYKNNYKTYTQTDKESDPYWTNAHKFHVDGADGAEYTIELTYFKIYQITQQPVLNKKGEPIEKLTYNIIKCRDSNVNQEEDKDNVQYRDVRCAQDDPYYWKDDAKRVEWAIGCNAIWPDCGITKPYVESKIECADSCPDGWTRAMGKCIKSITNNGGICEDKELPNNINEYAKISYANSCKLKWPSCIKDYDPMQEFNTSCAFSCPTIYDPKNTKIYPYTLSQENGEYKCKIPSVTDGNLNNESFKEGPVLKIGNEGENKDWLETANSSRPSDDKYEYKWCQCN